MSILRLGVFLLTALLAAGCTTTSSGDPKPQTSDAPPEDGSSRPREIRLDDLDPCALLPEADYDDFNVDQPGEPGETDNGAKQCIWNTDGGYLDVALITYEGIEEQETRAAKPQPTDPIEEFPTYNIRLDGIENSCFTAVDVADGQYLLTHVGRYSNSETGPTPCEHSDQVAESVMSALLS